MSGYWTRAKVAGITLALIFLVVGASARNYIVRPGGSEHAGGNGLSWRTSFRGFPSDASFWKAIEPGDTIFLAGGAYEGPWSIDEGGTREKPLVITRHISGIDEPVRIRGGGIWFGSGGVTVDGMNWGGIHIEVPPEDGAWGLSMAKPFGDLVVRHLKIEGPGWNDTHNVRGIDFTPSNGRSRNIRIEHCEIFNLANGIYTLNIDSVTVERCRIHHINSEGDVHENAWYSQGCNGGTFRWNTVYRSVAEGVYLQGGQRDWHICGNLFVRSWYGFATKKGFVHTGILIHNNTFVDVHFPVALKDPRDEARVVNNLFFPTEVGVIFPQNVDHDYNWYGETTSLGEPNGVPGFGQNPFLSPSREDYRLSGKTNAIDRGFGVAGCEHDALGTQRGLDGAWDIGAYERRGDDTSISIPANMIIEDQVGKQ